MLVFLTVTLARVASAAATSAPQLLEHASPALPGCETFWSICHLSLVYIGLSGLSGFRVLEFRVQVSKGFRFRVYDLGPANLQNLQNHCNLEDLRA